MPEQVKQGDSGSSKIQDIVEFVKRLCMAVTNVEMFSADHPLARRSIDNSFEWLADVIKRRNEPVVISVSGRSIVVEGLSLEDKNPLVNKLAKKFEDIHVSNLFFEKTVTAEEFVDLFRIVGKGPRYIDEHGGFPKLMAESKIEGIRLRDISYVMVTGDEKVVSKDARIVEGESVKDGEADSEVVKYMVWKVMQKADEQKWLLNEMKNNPQKMADLIVNGIELASSRAEMGVQTEDGSIDALLNNIRLVGQNLVDDNTGEIKEGEGDLEKALMSLETEMRVRSSKLMSSKVAAGFINEIMGVVTTYADRVRAKQVSDEFLKGETSLRKTEELFRKFAPKKEPVDKFILQVKERLARKGATEDDINKMIDGMEKSDKAKAPKKPSKPRKNYSQAVADGVSKRIKDLGVDPAKSQDAMESLSSFIEERAREKAGEFKSEAETLRADVARKGKVLEAVPFGVILWNPEGKPDFVNPAAKDALKADGIELKDALKRRLKEWTYPLSDVPDLAKENDLAEADVRFLMVVVHVVKEGDDVIGVALLPAK